MPKTKGLEGKGEEGGLRLGGWGSKALERELGGIFSSLFHKALSPLTTSTYLAPWVFFIPASGSGILGPESLSSKNVKGIMSPVSREEQDLFCWEVRGMAGYFDRSLPG